MGYVPSKLAGRTAAVALALALAALGVSLGLIAGDALGNGFTFDWYVHETHPSYEVAHVVFWASLGATVSALIATGIAVPLSYVSTRAWTARYRHVPPRYRDAVGLDVHWGHQAGILPGLSSLIAVAVIYVVVGLPLLGTDAAGVRGAPISELTANGFALLVAAGCGIGAFVGAYGASASTFDGVVSGRLVRGAGPNLIARISLFGSRNAAAVIAGVLVLTLVGGYYAQTVTTNVDVADVMPRGDPNTAAGKNLTSTFKSTFTQQVTFQFRILDPQNRTHNELYWSENARMLPLRVTDSRPGNITDELYIRAMAEVTDWVLSQPPFEGSAGPPDFYKLINWTIAGGKSDQNKEGDRAYRLPDTSRDGSIRYASVHEGVVRVGSVYAALDAVSSPTWRQAAVLVNVDPKEERSSKEIGRAALDLRDEWLRKVEDDPSLYRVFGPDNPPQFTVDMPLANAHASELTEHDFKLLLPIIAAFITLVLLVAFRSPVNVLVTFAALAIAVTWTFGVMGFLEIPLNTLNLATVPLIMGIGIDYGIHMMNEYQEFRAKGKSAEEAWTLAGSGSAFALLVGALTTIAGLVVMIVSPSLLVAQLGMLGVVAIVSCYVLAVLFIPAAITLLGGGKRASRAKYEPSRLMPKLATAVSRARIFTALVLLLVAGSAVSSASTLHREAFGDPPRNWLETDPLRIEHERALAGFYDTPEGNVKANVLIIEGDLTDPAVHAYINNLTAALRAGAVAGRYVDPSRDNEVFESRVIADTLRDLPFLLNTYLTVKDGLPGVGQFLGAGALENLFANNNQPPPEASRTYPRTSAEIRALLDGVFDSPLFEFANLFADYPDYGMTVITFSVRAATYEDAEDVWHEVQAAIAAADPSRPAGVKTAFFGNTAINYLFVAKQVPWLNAMMIVANIAVVVLVLLATLPRRGGAPPPRSLSPARRVVLAVERLKPALLVGAVSGLTTILWFGLLPLLDIGLAISLTLPIVFIAAMGSDYALHLALRCERTRDTHGTMASVGKGVLFSFITTFGAFLVFTRISDLAGRRSMVGTALAIAVIFVVTLLVVPVFFPVARGRRGRAAEHGAPIVEPAARATLDPAAPPPVVAPTLRDD